MTLYRKKPVVIEAFNWTGGPDQTEDPEWIVDAIRAGKVRFENEGTPDVALLIDTLEGTHRANRGDWIIRGVKGELYPCKPDIFALTYESDESHSVSCLYEYALARLGLEDSEALRVLFWDTHNELVWNDHTDWCEVPYRSPKCTKCGME